MAKQKNKSYLEEGKYCSKCKTEVEICFDEDWDETGFVILPYCFCLKCKERRY